MRLYILLVAGGLVFKNGIGQSPERYLYQEAVADGGKPAIDFNAIGQWSRALSARLNTATLSRDGRNCSYQIRDGMVLQSTEDGWRQELKGVKEGFFSGNNKEYCWLEGGSFHMLQLGTDQRQTIANVSEYKIGDTEGVNEWVVIRLKDSSCILKNLLSRKEQKFNDVKTVSFAGNEWFCSLDAKGTLSIMRLSSGKVRLYNYVDSYGFDRLNKVLVLKVKKDKIHSLHWVNAHTGQSKEIWSSGDKAVQAGSYAVDPSCSRLAFMVETTKEGKTARSLWYYRVGMERSEERVSRESAGFGEKLDLTGTPHFNDDGRYIIFSLKPGITDTRKPKVDAVKLDVWHYRDKFLMSAQVAGVKHLLVKNWLRESEYRAAVLSEGSSKVVRLTGEEEIMMGNVRGDYALVRWRSETGRFWELEYAYSLVSLKDGVRRSLKKSVVFWYSPSGVMDWLLGYDGEQAQYLRYDIATDSYHSLSSSVPEWLGGEDEFCNFGHTRQYADGTGSNGFIGWVDENSVLVYDYYDIWELDVKGKTPPVNLTGGYGRKHRIRLEVMGLEKGDIPVMRRRQRLLLAALNMETKENGFYAINLDRPGAPEQLCIGSYLYYVDRSKYGHSSGGWQPLKARNAEVWLVQRQSALEPSNLYLTSDFKRFKKITDIQAPQSYNWLRTELVRFTQQDGTLGTGILYLPENFDEKKKYPVLINYYNQESIRLNEYLNPAYTNDAHINIPWFVSRGYLLFFPDIYFNKESTGASALNAVEGAAAWLAKQRYVDSTKLGIAGHSVGGGLTNYILTHSTRFAAVFEGAGVSDWVSAQLQLSWDDGWPRLGLGNALGNEIWTDPERYKENPILHADRVTSPLLIFHCKNDAAVPFEQGVELFTALWRLGKKVWMLQYDGGDHNLIVLKARQDLTVRVTQFFDHYLKGGAPPFWMTRGVDGRLKGIENGLELDTTGRQP